MNGHDYAPPCDTMTLQVLYYGKKMTYREIATYLKVSPTRIRTAMQHFELVPRESKPRSQHGKDNSNWKGDKAGYGAFHQRLYANQANRCEVCGTTDKSKTYDWASLTKDYSNPKDYKRMCRGCHWRYDGTIKNITGGVSPPDADLRKQQ